MLPAKIAPNPARPTPLALQSYERYIQQKYGGQTGAVGSSGSGNSSLNWSIKDRTSSRGMTQSALSMLSAATAAAKGMGLNLQLTAGMGQGHLSHQWGTEADMIGYHADGSPWTKAERLAVAQAAAGAGANRFGLYPGNSLHLGVGNTHVPANVVWNAQKRGVPAVSTFDPVEQAFVKAVRSGTYRSSTGVNPSSSYDPQVAALQKELNAQGANLKVDGLYGPRTQAAFQQYVTQQPTAVASNAKPPAAVTQQGALPALGYGTLAPITPAGQNAGKPLASASRPYPGPSGAVNPYTNSTGGAAALNPTPVPTTRIQAAGIPGATPAYGTTGYYIPPASNVRSVPTMPYAGAVPPPVPLSPVSIYNYTGAAPGLVPVAPPAPIIGTYATPPAATPPAAQQGAGLWSQIAGALPAGLTEKVTKGGAMLKEALRTLMQNSSGNSYTGSGYGGNYNSYGSGGSGWSGYTGGTYGGAGGGSINQGVGGAFKSR